MPSIEEHLEDISPEDMKKLLKNFYIHLMNLEERVRKLEK